MNEHSSEHHPSPLFMMQLRLDGRRLQSWNRGQRFPRGAEDDLGYLLHGLLQALFGDLAPKPFHARSRGSDVEVLGYLGAGEAQLRDRLATFAEPAAAACLADPRDLAVKAMPERWAPGRRLGFEVRTCPVVRVGRAAAAYKPGSEVDAFLAACTRSGEDVRIGRETVYRDWLAGRLEGAAALTRHELKGFRRRRLLRKTQGTKREARVRERPDALVAGELEVVDGEAFARLLARGVGRHRAFGFGMLLLRPPGLAAGAR